MNEPFKIGISSRENICKDSLRKYYRFRKTKFYGGCATADCIGCNLRCAYCWAQKKVWNDEKYGVHFSSQEVFNKLAKMNLRLFRVSGGEPTICKEHLVELLNLIPSNKIFILETNGILLNESYVNELSNFQNIYVRVSLKGVDADTFERITGVNGVFFKNQLQALKLLEKYEVRHGAAILIDLYTDKQIEKLGIPNLEYETLIDYPFVMKSLEKRNIKLAR